VIEVTNPKERRVAPVRTSGIQRGERRRLHPAGLRHRATAAQRTTGGAVNLDPSERPSLDRAGCQGWIGGSDGDQCRHHVMTAMAQNPTISQPCRLAA
jgi:hypothetical protein